jgi:hypothetical protein
VNRLSGGISIFQYLIGLGQLLNGCWGQVVLFWFCGGGDWFGVGGDLLFYVQLVVVELQVQGPDLFLTGLVQF